MNVRITNFGSCCIDNVYRVPHFVRPGETLPTLSHDIYPGGKGLNQSLALAAAGASVQHAGRVGADGEWLRTLLAERGVDVELLRVGEGASGHAVIQVNPAGENAIVIFGGTNRSMSDEDVADVLSQCRVGEYLLLQNEINRTPEIMKAAASRELKVVFNAAPMADDVLAYPLEIVSLFVVNEIEGQALSGKTRPEEIIDEMLARFPGAGVALTLGDQGAMYGDESQRLVQPAFRVDAVDTTGAGDTFTGYFLEGLSGGADTAVALRTACQAAAICVTRPGAASSIPLLREVHATGGQDQASSGSR